MPFGNQDGAGHPTPSCCYIALLRDVNQANPLFKIRIGSIGHMRVRDLNLTGAGRNQQISKLPEVMVCTSKPFGPVTSSVSDGGASVASTGASAA